MEATIIMDDDVQALARAAREIMKGLRERGLDRDAIRRLLEDEPGKAAIAADGGLLVGRTRVNLTPLERALYGLLLGHPEGIRPADFWMHYDELLEIYRHMTVFFDSDRTEAAVDAICDDDRKALRVNFARIRRKVREAGGEEAARRYAVSLAPDGAYRIPFGKEILAS